MSMRVIGEPVKGSNNFLRRGAFTVTPVAQRFLDANAFRVAYRIIADPENNDQIIHGYDSTVTNETTFNLIFPGRIYRDEGKDTCYKGPVYLLGNLANQEVIIEEVVSQ